MQKSMNLSTHGKLSYFNILFLFFFLEFFLIKMKYSVFFQTNYLFWMLWRHRIFTEIFIYDYLTKTAAHHKHKNHHLSSWKDDSLNRCKSNTVHNKNKNFKTHRIVLWRTKRIYIKKIFWLSKFFWCTKVIMSIITLYSTGSQNFVSCRNSKFVYTIQYFNALKPSTSSIPQRVNYRSNNIVSSLKFDLYNEYKVFLILNFISSERWINCECSALSEQLKTCS